MMYKVTDSKALAFLESLFVGIAKNEINFYEASGTKDFGVKVQDTFHKEERNIYGDFEDVVLLNDNEKLYFQVSTRHKGTNILWMFPAHTKLPTKFSCKPFPSI